MRDREGAITWDGGAEARQAEAGVIGKLVLHTRYRGRAAAAAARVAEGGDIIGDIDEVNKTDEEDGDC